MDIWQWTLTKDAIAPCFVRDVLEMRQHADKEFDFFWLGHTPCRTVLVVGMVVAIQVYDKRAVYTVDDGTAVIDCVLRHPQPALGPRSPPRPAVSSKTQRSSPKKPRFNEGKHESLEPPAPITEPGYPVRVLGRVMRHHQTKQIYAESIEPCPSSLDEIAHLERVIELHKTKYSLPISFVPPPKPMSSAPSREGADANVFSNTSLSLRPGPSSAPYTLPPPPICTKMPLQDRNRPPPLPTHVQPSYLGNTHVPSSPTASSIASSTPSSPCKSSSPTKSELHEEPRKAKLRHPSRLHTHDLTANTFRLYVKHYMDNAPPSFCVFTSSPSRSTCGAMTTPKKHTRAEDDNATPRPKARNTIWTSKEDEDEDGPTLGFTMSHLRRVPELALLAARVVRAETRKRDKADREKEREKSRVASSSGKPNGNVPAPVSRTEVGSRADLPRKKIARLFSWAVVKLYEEGSIVLWDGDVRPLPVPPLPLPVPSPSGLWNDGTGGSAVASLATCGVPSVSPDRDRGTSASILYTSSASASLYSHYHAPRRRSGKGVDRGESTCDVDDSVDVDADPAYLSDPPLDEEAYVPLTPRFLAGYVEEAMNVLRRGRSGNGGQRGGGGMTGREPTAEEILGYMRRSDGRWARVGVWAVEEALMALTAARSR